MNLIINPTQVNWDSDDSVAFFNIKHAQPDIFLSSIPHLPSLPAHIWLTTSGRFHLKWVALSKKALLHSAQSVNTHLLVSCKDRWGLCLPVFHVGGLSILARGYLSKSSVVHFNEKWSATGFVQFLIKKKITLTSLVPSQVYDIVQEGQLCPQHLRAVVVGGEALSPVLYQLARDLHWPLLPSYGLTECASQVATAELNSLGNSHFPQLKLLPHVQLIINQQGEIGLSSTSILTGFIRVSSDKAAVFQEGTDHGWYWTGDYGSKNNDFVSLNPSRDKIKILGEFINVERLEQELLQLLLKYKIAGSCIILPLPCARQGYQIALVSSMYDQNALYKIIRQFNQRVLPVEKIQSLYFVPSLPRSSISKVLRSDLLKTLGFFTGEPC